MLAPTLINVSPPSGQAAQTVRQATLIMIQQRTIAASCPLGLGYSIRLTMSQATAKIPANATGDGRKSSTIDTTDMAPIGIGRPMKSPLLVFTQANLASRTTPAVSTEPAA